MSASVERESLPNKFKVVTLWITLCLCGLVFLSDVIYPSIIFHDQAFINMDTTLDLGVRDNFTATEKYFILFVIPSLPRKTTIRETIRSTWMNVSGWNELRDVEDEYKRIKVMFIFGQMKDAEYTPEFLEEVEKYDDMFVVEGLIEHRTVLKYKVLWGMARSLHYDYDYLAKTDDDVLVNLPQLIKSLIVARREMLYTGRCAMSYGGFRGLPKFTYCSGGGYVLSRDLISKFGELGTSVQHVPFRPEDGYTGWLVYNVRKAYNFTVNPLEGNGKALKLAGYECGAFNGWFYHKMGNIGTMNRVFGMINTNETIRC